MRSRKQRARWRGLLAVAVLVIANLAVLGAAPAAAEGTETLGPPSIALAEGTGVATGGTGLFEQPGTIEVDVPAGASVKQVLLYWQGVASEAKGPDNTVVVDGQTVEGDIIGGPTHFYTVGGVEYFATSLRADITGLGLVGPGSNQLQVDGMDFGRENDGAGVVVIFDTGVGQNHIDLRDGVDTAFAGFTGERATTAPQTFSFAAVDFQRTAELTLMVGSVGTNRSNTVEITVGGQTTTLTNSLSSADGSQWDTFTREVTIPADADSLTVQVLSGDGGGNPASLVWVDAVLSVAACPPAPDIQASTSGAAYALDAELLDQDLINELGRVETQAPPSQQASDEQLTVPVPGVVEAGLLTTSSESSVQSGTAETRSQATTADLNLLSGAITATLVRGVSHSQASFGAATFDSSGSHFVDLEINGDPLTNVAPNTRVAVRNPLMPTQVIAEAVLREESGDSSLGLGVAEAHHSINMIRVTLLEPFGDLEKGAEIIVSHANSEATSPADPCPNPDAVSGLAFAASADARLGGQSVATGNIGEANLPPTGGSDTTAVAEITEPGLIESGTAVDTTSGSLDPDPNATARSVIEDADVLGGLVTADVLDVRASSLADGTTADTTFEVTFTNLQVAGATFDVDPAPNTTITTSLPDGSILVVTLNEQMEAGDGSTVTEGTVNAIHATLFDGDGRVVAEVIVASAHSDART